MPISNPERNQLNIPDEADTLGPAFGSVASVEVGPYASPDSWEIVLQRHLVNIETKLNQLCMKIDKGLQEKGQLRTPRHDIAHLRRVASASDVRAPPTPGEIVSPPVDDLTFLSHSLSHMSSVNEPCEPTSAPGTAKAVQGTTPKSSRTTGKWSRASKSPRAVENKRRSMVDYINEQGRRNSLVAWRTSDARGLLGPKANISRVAINHLNKIRSSESLSCCFEATLLAKFVHSMPFQITASIVILVHALYTGFATDAVLKAAIDQSDAPVAWQAVEHCFSVFFAGELLVRAAGERCFFLIGSWWRWNLFDSCLVILSIVDASVGASSQLRNVFVARMLRLLRFARIFRLARAIQVVNSLRILVSTIWESISSLGWCMLVVFFVIYCFTLVVLSGVTEHLREEHPDKEKKVLLVYYGSVFRTMATLFMAITSGVDWRDAMLPLKNIHWLYEPLFNLYIAFMYLGVLNVVIGAFVTTTTEINNRDKDQMIKRELGRLTVFSRDVEDLFKAADVDGSHSLSWTELRDYLQDPKVKAYFQALEFDVHQARTLFTLLDADGNDEVTLQEFLEGCIRLRGQARSIDMNLVLLKTDELLWSQQVFSQYVEEQFAKLRRQQ